MRVIMFLMLVVTACAVESVADSSLAVVGAADDITTTQASELVSQLVDDTDQADSDDYGAVTNTDSCPPVTRCDPLNLCCWTRQQSVCCLDSHYEPGPGGTVLVYDCTCRPLPHTDPGHGIPQEPFAPTGGEL